MVCKVHPFSVFQKTASALVCMLHTLSALQWEYLAYGAMRVFSSSG